VYSVNGKEVDQAFSVAILWGIMHDLPRRAGIRLHAPLAQSATFVELFFDLVFVFAVTQVTALTVHDLTLAGVGRSLILFWLIWWAWTQFTWTLNPADTTHPIVRVVTLLATAAAFVMAASVTRAFTGDALWFAVPYLVVRILGLVLQVRVDLERTDEHRAGIGWWVSGSSLGLALVLAGSAVDPSMRTAIWGAAILVDLLATQAASGRVWDIHTGHLAERHALFVIVALGESLILAGTAVADEARTKPLIVAGAGALLVSCLLWWIYFGWFKEALEERLSGADPRDIGRLSRDAYSLGHFPMLVGIIGFAVAIEEIVAHPNAPLPPPVLAALTAGVGLFVGFSVVAYWQLTRRVLVPRLGMLVVMVGAMVAVAGLPPVWPMLVVAAALLGIALIEAIRPEPVVGAIEASEPD
jgi:low temperature requirement protein LtrA